MRETISMCSPLSDPEWLHIARHEAGHAVAYILASLDIFQNTFGVSSLEIRPGRTNFRYDSRGKPMYCSGACDSSNIYGAVGTDLAKIYVSRHREILPNRIKAAEWEIIACVSGPYADLISQGVKSRNSMRWNSRMYGGGKSDFEFADAVFADLCVLAGRRAGWVKLLDRTRTLVFENWNAIDALAHKLLDRHRLENEEIVEVLAPYLPVITRRNAA